MRLLVVEKRYRRSLREVVVGSLLVVHPVFVPGVLPALPLVVRKYLLLFRGAGEYISNDKKLFCRQKGVRLEFSAPYETQKTENLRGIGGSSLQWLDVF